MCQCLSSGMINELYEAKRPSERAGAATCRRRRTLPSAATTSQPVTCPPSLAETLVKEATETEEAATRLGMTTTSFKNWISLCRLVAFLAKNQCAHDRLNMSCLALREGNP